LDVNPSVVLGESQWNLQGGHQEAKEARALEEMKESDSDDHRLRSHAGTCHRPESKHTMPGRREIEPLKENARGSGSFGKRNPA
jgi:hypothetical protein